MLYYVRERATETATLRVFETRAGADALADQLRKARREAGVRGTTRVFHRAVKVDGCILDAYVVVNRQRKES